MTETDGPRDDTDARCYVVVCPRCGDLRCALAADYPVKAGPDAWAEEVARWEADGYEVRRMSGAEVRARFGVR